MTPRSKGRPPSEGAVNDSERSDLAPAAWPGWRSGPEAGFGEAGSFGWNRWGYRARTWSPDSQLKQKKPCWPGQREPAEAGWGESRVACESARHKIRSERRRTDSSDKATESRRCRHTYFSSQRVHINRWRAQKQKGKNKNGLRESKITKNISN